MESNPGIELIYSCQRVEPEEEDCVWNKQTVQYYANNLGKLRKHIGCLARNLSPSEVDVVLSKLGEYLERGKEYGELYNGEENLLSLEQYISKCAQLCIKRYQHEKSVEHKDIVNNISETENGDEKSILDNLRDTHVIGAFESVEYDFEQELEQMQYKRYLYGVDIYNLLYISLIKDIRNEDNYESLLEAFGIDYKQLQIAYRKAECDEDFMHLISSICVEINKMCISGLLGTLRKYVYGRNRIEKAIEAYSVCM